MDPTADCPICFETFGATANCEELKVTCCDQSICRHCCDCLRRCPFCRVLWHGEEDEETPQWQRRSFPNPILAFWGTTLAIDVVRASACAGFASARALAAAATAAASDASPVLIASSVAGGVAVAGGLALLLASQPSARAAAHLQQVIRGRRGQLMRSIPWRTAAVELWEVLQWHLSPMKEGLPHVYHGSPWRTQQQQRFLSRVQGLLLSETTADSQEAAAEATSQAGGHLWSDVIRCYVLWLEYTPHAANWGACASYGLPPLNLCWHNRWREDLRHAVSALAKAIAGRSEVNQLDSKERGCLECLLSMLDHILSWQVTTLDRGHSELIQADWCHYPSFCQKLKERFAFAWANALAPAEAEVDLAGFGSHAEIMASREVPEGFQDLW
ncbi:unnamed protein product [Polarella glacialis]|uniref:RING-type domain-containing protein n=1 Tax=Polarella glacialis TaxID=89957 RepID=A0A813L5A6_POLGL|nr:unnamed protein product [Polarella glacialis]